MKIRSDLHVPEPFAARMDELATICDGLVVACHEVARGSAEHPDPGSQIALESSVFRADHENAPNNLEYAPAQAATSFAESIRLQLAAISALLRSREVVGSLWPLVRAQLETAGRVSWLLEPTIAQPAGEVRVARYFLEVVSSLQRQRFTTGKYDRSAEKYFKTQRDATIETAQEVFPELAFDLSGPDVIPAWTLNGEPMIGLGAGAALFGSHYLTGPSKALYDILSDYSHPSLVSIELQSRVVDDGEVSSSPRAVTVDEVEHQVRWACIILYKTCQIICAYLGLNSAALEQWADLVPKSWFDEAL
jgi:hypothetical protein